MMKKFESERVKVDSLKAELKVQKQVRMCFHLELFIVENIELVKYSAECCLICGKNTQFYRFRSYRSLTSQTHFSGKKYSI